MAAPMTARRRWRRLGIASAVALLGVLGLAASSAYRVLTPRPGERTGPGPSSLAEYLRAVREITLDPRAGFPGKERLQILLLGIDGPAGEGPRAYRRLARSDTLVLVSLDLRHRRVAALSIPRDTYVRLVGTPKRGKINAAYAYGGAAAAMATVGEFLGLRPDAYVVVSIDALRTLVDALGGVEVTVEHPMDYDDQAAGLHIHLRPGRQRLNGEQAIAFVRFRKLNPPGPGWLSRLFSGREQEKPLEHDEVGEQRRMYRQQVLLHAMLARGRSLPNLLQVSRLTDLAMASVRTNLTRTQIFDLAALFRGVRASDVVTAQLPATFFRAPDGGGDFMVDEPAKRLYVDWLLRGDERAARGLTPVVLVDATGTAGVAAEAREALQRAGYARVTAGSGYPAHLDTRRTHLLDAGVPDGGTTHRVAALLGVLDSCAVQSSPRPRGIVWPPSASLTVILGEDYAARARQRALAREERSG